MKISEKRLQALWANDRRKVAQMTTLEQDDFMRDMARHYEKWSASDQEAACGILVAIIDQAQAVTRD